MVQTANVTFKVMQECWQWCHSIGHIRFPIRLNCNRVSILHSFRDIVTYFQNLKRSSRHSRDPERIPFGVNLVSYTH